jgi:hypothetical protein
LSVLYPFLKFFFFLLFLPQEMDKRLRASQRRQLVQEMESRDLTFNPAINKNSIRIVERLNRERQAQLAMSAHLNASSDGATSPGAGGEPIVPSSRVAAAKKALTAALAAGLSLPTAAQVTGLPVPDPKLLRSLGRSYLPGHEEETFHPKINARSAALAAAVMSSSGASGVPPGSPGAGLKEINPAFTDQNVYNRLYLAVTQARSTKVKGKGERGGSKSPKGGKTAPLMGGSGSSAGADDDESSQQQQARKDSNGYPIDDQGEPLAGHPQYFNVIPFVSSSTIASAGGSGGAGASTVTPMDFILRRLVPAGSASSSSSSYSTGAVPSALSALLQQSQQ